MTVLIEDIRFAGAEGDSIGGCLALFQGEEPVPGIVLIHEVFGLDAHIRGLVRRFAEAGFCVLAPDLYSREGVPGPQGTEADPDPIWETEAALQADRRLPDRRALSDIDGAAAFLAARSEADGDRIAAVGFCMGGTLAFLSGCTSRRLAGVVEFCGRVLYPELSAAKPIQPLELALNLDCPLLAFFGELDEGIPSEDVDRMRTVLDSAAKNFEIVCYPEARYGFFNDRRRNHAPQAAEDAWRRTLAFLREDL